MSTLIAPHSWPATPPSSGGSALAARPSDTAVQAAVHDAATLVWTSRRNCSLTPSQLFGFYALLCAVTLLIALGFWVAGAPAMLPFAGAESVAVGLALLVHARHVGDHETLRVADGRILIEQHRAASVACTTLRADGARIELASGHGALIAVVAQGQCALVGRYLRASQRAALARELRLALSRAPATWNMNLQPQQ